jgi:hypothetical protein
MPIRQSGDVGQGGEGVEQQEAVVVVVLAGVQVEEQQRNKMLKEIIYKMINNDKKWRVVAVPNSFTLKIINFIL